MYKRYTMEVSQPSLAQFNLEITNPEELLMVLNHLQNEPFMVNEDHLAYINDNRVELVNAGLLLPYELSRCSLSTLRASLRKAYDKNQEVKSVTTFQTLLSTLSKHLSQAYQQDQILTIATLFKGYTLYLPAFMDFRGRIYHRSKDLHGNDLTRSLLLFATSYIPKYSTDDYSFPHLDEEEEVQRSQSTTTPNKEETKATKHHLDAKGIIEVLLKQAACNYKRWSNMDAALTWMKSKLVDFKSADQKTSKDRDRSYLEKPYLSSSDLDQPENKEDILFLGSDQPETVSVSSTQQHILELVKGARQPFLFLSFLRPLMIGGSLLAHRTACIPIYQDASASAYQLLAYFTLNEKIATRTNLIRGLTLNKESFTEGSNDIQDIYEYYKDGLKRYLYHKLNQEMYNLIEPNLTRKLVKSIFMPMIYGKSMFSVGVSIKEESSLGKILTKKDCIHLAKDIKNYWSQDNQIGYLLMKLLSNIGWLCSIQNKKLFYSNKYYRTIQDYKKSEVRNKEQRLGINASNCFPLVVEERSSISLPCRGWSPNYILKPGQVTRQVPLAPILPLV